MKNKIYCFLSVILVVHFFSCDRSNVNTPQCSENIKTESTKYPKSELLVKKYETLSDTAINFRRLLYKTANQSTSLRSDGIINNIRNVGPNGVGGRIRGFVQDHSNADHLIASGVSGGIWKSTDRGQTWMPTDVASSNLSVTAITQSPFDANIYYYTTGEFTGNSAGIDGVGIFKSTDGGNTFNLLMSTETSDFDQTWHIEHSKTDPNTVFVASVDGLFVSRNAGSTFTKLKEGHWCDVMAKEDGGVFACKVSGGLWYSSNGMLDFNKMTNDFPSDFNYDRFRIDYCKSQPNTIYAAFSGTLSTENFFVMRSDDNGQNWRKLETSNIGFDQLFYCLTMSVSPVNPDHAIVGANGAAYTTNGGNNFFGFSGGQVHADMHIAHFAFDDPNEIFTGTDGGIETVLNDNNTYRIGEKLNNGFYITQYYNGVAQKNGDQLVGGTQDNGVLAGEVSVEQHEEISGGDGAYCAFNPVNENQAYISTQNGAIYRVDDFEAGSNPVYIAANLQGDSPWFVTPLYADNEDGNLVYTCSQKRAFVSEDNGDQWRPITAPFANSLPHTVATMTMNGDKNIFIGGSGLDLMRIEDFDNHTAGEEYPMTYNKPTLGGFVKQIVAHPTEDAIIIALSSYSSASRIWKVGNLNEGEANETWTALGNNLPSYLPVNSIVIDPNDPAIMIVGTDYGVYSTTDAGAVWVKETAIPDVVIANINLSPSGEVTIFTHGRSIFRGEIANSTAVTEVERTNVKIYPNPAQDYINIQSNMTTESAYEIVDINGVSRQRGTCFDGSRLDIVDLHAGNYFLILNENIDGSKAVPFVKM